MSAPDVSVHPETAQSDSREDADEFSAVKKSDFFFFSPPTDIFETFVIVAALKKFLLWWRNEIPSVQKAITHRLL